MRPRPSAEWFFLVTFFGHPKKVTRPWRNKAARRAKKARAAWPLKNISEKTPPGGRRETFQKMARAAGPEKNNARREPFLRDFLGEQKVPRRRQNARRAKEARPQAQREQRPEGEKNPFKKKPGPQAQREQRPEGRKTYIWTIVVIKASHQTPHMNIFLVWLYMDADCP